MNDCLEHPVIEETNVWKADATLFDVRTRKKLQTRLAAICFVEMSIYLEPVIPRTDAAASAFSFFISDGSTALALPALKRR